MKKIYINMKVLVAILLISNQMFVSGQTQVTRYTPKGSSVRAYNNIPEMSSTDKADWSSYVTTQFPNATEINPPSATRSYNCHAYAWHVKEGGDAVWIGYYAGQEADEDIYWTDGSYVEQASETNAEKISYYTGNHSAVQSDVQGVYISKWGQGPLMKHQHDDGPSIYNMTYRKYYKKALANPTISGPSRICTQGTYTLDNLAAGATVVWSATPSGIVSYPPSGSSVTLTKVGNSIIILTALINNSITLTKTVYVGSPQAVGIVSMSNLTYGGGNWFKVLPGTGFYNYEGSLTVGDDGLGTSYSWSLASKTPGKAAFWSTNGPYVDVAMKTTNTDLQLMCTSSNSCGSHSTYYTFSTGDMVPELVSLIPNPTSSQVEVNIGDAVATNALLSSTAENSNSTSYQIQVVDSYGLTVYSTTKKEKKFTLQTSSFRNGVYAVIVSDGINTYQNKLIVNH